MEETLRRQDASAAVTHLGWRFLLGTLRTGVAVGSLSQAAEVATLAVTTCGAEADDHLRVDLRPSRVTLTLQSPKQATVTSHDVDLARRLTAALSDVGRQTDPWSTQLLEIAIDALDIAAIRPFWAALLGYTPEADTDVVLIDPQGQGPTIWFQQMDQPRPQRNRIHFDLCVPHDEAEHRLSTALSAGGRLVSAKDAPAFWILADPEGNEACITTWQGRDD
ncbi:4a-hydroxytetrahydrobiopterin dehydratase [Asanoa hainanensis]|uniref:4a-hydroxytetrahydrobiopterin dehydratase n=1 Tax=Asanoa hainanensis TaxID=560556 RepID=A0A239NF74_9ACTN|nr:VOC family protein [Asanoa hainanensis]SNT53064.1 4a-hydroxytetrahydrobiopterin dehydratase [Asanoa hainanensis]